MNDENMKLIMAEFAKINQKLEKLEEENVETHKRLGMIELKLDNLQDNYEKIERDFFGLAGEMKAGFYKTKHQLRALEGQGETIVKILEYRGLLLGLEKSMKI